MVPGRRVVSRVVGWSPGRADRYRG